MSESQPGTADPKPKCSNFMLEEALAYAATGWKVFPIHGIADSRCTCPRGGSCQHPGKHPMTEHGHHDATSDPAQIRRWWKQSPTANIGVACRASHLIVIDVDPRNGGNETLDALLTKHGASSLETLTADTGGGGRHYIFVNPELNSG